MPEAAVCKDCRFLLFYVALYAAEIHTVDKYAALGGAAQEAAVDACLAELLQEKVFARLVEGRQVAHAALAEKEGVEAHLAAGKYVEAGARRGCAAHQGAEKAAVADAAVAEQGVVAEQAVQYQFQV